MTFPLIHPLTQKSWDKIGQKHHHGVNIPLGAIRTHQSSGIGEFLDLLPLIDWCHRLRFDVIQLLPLNESGPSEPSPYNALSSCALHPIYLSLHALPLTENLSALPPLQRHLTALNTTKHLAYREVLALKNSYLIHYLSAVKEELKKKESYITFVKEEEWLLDYALFKALKNSYRERHWQEWPEKARHPSHTRKKQWLKTYSEEIEFHCLIQYLCFSQLQQAKAYAEEKKVWLKGDIPILVNPDSADVWAHRAFFHLDQIVGRPSSALEPEGQYWGFPLYNWKAMEENHFEWWKKRLQTAAKLYHIYRIDHIIGFFSLWTIPAGQHPKTGRYIPSDPNLMEAQGRHLLATLLSFTDMLPIGEDLGDPDPCIQKVLTEYGIPGTKIFRWQRNWDKDHSFIPYEDYPPISMSSVSTHDLATVALWWRTFPKEAAAYAAFKKWRQTPQLSQDHHLEILWDNHHSGSLFHINLLQEYLALAPHVTWEDPQDERINYPGTVQPQNWTYRYKMPLELLMEDSPLNQAFERILAP